MSDKHPRPWRVEDFFVECEIRDSRGTPIGEPADGHSRVRFDRETADLIVAAVNAYEPPTERERFMEEWENQTLSPEEADAMIASMEVFRGFRGTDPEADMPLPDPR